MRNYFIYHYTLVLLMYYGFYVLDPRLDARIGINRYTRGGLFFFSSFFSI